MIGGQETPSFLNKLAQRLQQNFKQSKGFSLILQDRCSNWQEELKGLINLVA